MKVFSVKKYVEDCRKDGDSERFIKECLNKWGYTASGLTKEQMLQIGLVTRDDWMEEV